MVLLDTVVLSELRKARPSARLVEWFDGQRDDEVFLSVVTLGEIERGIEKKRGSEPEFARQLERWLEELQRLYADRILPVTAPVARRWGLLSAQRGHDGADLLIAATAYVHGLGIATRNVKHFSRCGVDVVNPFESLPSA